MVAARSHAGDIIEERRTEIFRAATPPPAVIMVPPAAPVEVVSTTRVVREISPARSYTATTTTVDPSAAPVIVEARPREFSDEIAVGPLAVVTADRHRSRDQDDIRSEIRHLERQLARRERHHGDRELVRAERLSTGELVLFEESVEEVVEPRRGVRIEKDKKGRMSISVPKYPR